jgi:hypothetical protein
MDRDRDRGQETGGRRQKKEDKKALFPSRSTISLAVEMGIFVIGGAVRVFIHDPQSSSRPW